MKIGTLLIVFVATMVGTLPLWSIDITINPPRISVPGSPDIEQVIANELDTLSDALEDELGERLGPYETDSLLTGFTLASAYGSHVASQRNLYSYDIFSITLGSLLGVQAPSFSDFGNGDFIEGLGADGSAVSGLSWQLWNIHIGINGGALLDGLFLGVKFGYTQFALSDFQLAGWTTGLSASYQFIKPVRTPIINWHGLIAGSGTLLQYSTISLNTGKLSPETVVSRLPDGASTLTLSYEPEIEYSLETVTFVIPIELLTGASLKVGPGITVGLGADIVFGSSRNSIAVDGELQHFVGGTLAEQDDAIIIEESEDESTIEISDGDLRLTHIRPKLMTNLTFSLGPAYVDIPFTYYFLDGSGVNVGINVGISL